MKTKTLAETMRELTASSQYRKAKSEMMKLQRKFSTITHVMVTNPNEQTIEMFQNEGFNVEQTLIKEYNQFKISW